MSQDLVPEYQIDEPIDLRADLASLGIEEVDKGVCEDNYENRGILRRAKLNWDPVFSTNGVPTGLIRARSKESTKERRLLSLAEKRPLLVNQSDNNSDYLTGLDLLAEQASDYLVPPWVVHSTRLYLKEQEDGGPKSAKRQPLCQPHRCRQIKDDSIRCMLWASGRPKDDGLCRIHLRSTKKLTSDDIERARNKLMQAAPYAVDKLEELMEYAESEPVMLKAATEILDRAGVRGGIEIDSNVNIDVRPAAEVLNERLNRLAAGAIHTAARLSQEGMDVVDAEVVEEPASSGSETFNESLDQPVDVTEQTSEGNGSITFNESLKERPVDDVDDVHDGVDNSGERPALPKEEK
jgi:hypothetical protein